MTAGETGPDLSRHIPTEVKHQALLQALQPLCELLNITPAHILAAPGIQIGSERITFAVPAPATADDWNRPHPRKRRADVNLQVNTAAELAQIISVRVRVP